MELERTTVEKALREIEEDAKRCRRIVKSVLQFARQESSAKTLSNLNDAVRSALRSAKKLPQYRRATIEFHPSDPLPMIFMNRTEMEQAVANLIHNGIESCHRNPQIVLRTFIKGRGIGLSVEDNGRGVPKHLEKHLFGPFFTTRRSEGGTGLGLSLTHSIISDHGGIIVLKASSDRGTTFVIELPYLKYNGGNE